MKPIKQPEVFIQVKFDLYVTVLLFAVYVFVGEHIAMVDFVRCLQNRKLLETGNYMVISVDDEIYDAKRRSNIMERGRYIKYCFCCFVWFTY